MPDPTKNINRDLLNRWQKQETKLTQISPGCRYNSLGIAWTLPNTETAESPIYMWEKSDAMVVSASFLRCRNIGLSWQMKKNGATRYMLKPVY